MTARQCAFCGTWVPESSDTCPKCREPVRELRRASPGAEQGKQKIRRGLMYMWIAGLVYYLAKGYAEPLHLPTAYLPVLTEYLLPFMFLGGLALIGFGLFRRMQG
jgi:hypothetical protein